MLRKMQLQGLRLGIERAASGSLDQRSTNWTTEAVADSFGASSVYVICVVMPVKYKGTCINDNIWHLHSLSIDEI